VGNERIDDGNPATLSGNATASINLIVRRRVKTMRQITRLALVTILLLDCVGCDQVSKHIARAHFRSDLVNSFAGDTLRVTYAENKREGKRVSNEFADMAPARAVLGLNLRRADRDLSHVARAHPTI
jgi:hypothetical protein